MCSVLIVERKLKNSCKKGRKNVLQKMWKKITGWVKVLWSMRGKTRFSDSSAESEKQRIKNGEFENRRTRIKKINDNERPL